MWRWMFGFKEESSIPVGAAYKGDGLYNLYCLGCSSNYSSEASMLLHDWVSQCLLYFRHASFRRLTTERSYFTALRTSFFFFNLNCNLKCVLLGLIEIIERELIHFILIWVSNYIVSTLDKSIKIQLNTWVIFKVFSSKWCENHCIEKEYLFVFTWKDSNC